MTMDRVVLRGATGRLVGRVSAEEVHIPPELVLAFAVFVRDTVRRELRAAREAGGETDPEVPHWLWPCPSRRAAVALAKSGAIDGVRRVGRGRGTAYLARRSALEAWIERESARGTEAEPVDDFARAMTHAGLVRGAARAGGP
jgi:hypothetical protein